MQVYNRKEKSYYTDVQYGGGFLKKLYGTRFGRFVMPLVLSRPISKIGGVYTDTFLSKGNIKGFIEKNHINMEEYIPKKYKSLNDFFTREIRQECRPMQDDPDAFVSPADSKLSVYPIESDNRILIKGNEYTVPDLVGKDTDISSYQGGMCLVFRLSVDDYHRYGFSDSGRIKSSRHIKGRLHTVCDISSAYKVYQENSRVVTVLDTDHFGEIIVIEVGALMVGRIVNHDKQSFSKGEEKGYFRLGGSTIAVLVRKDTLQLDEDIASHIAQGMEVKLRFRETIGRNVL